MYRWAETKEWKERAVGVVKVLTSADGTHRVVMRRDQVWLFEVFQFRILCSESFSITAYKAPVRSAGT